MQPSFTAILIHFKAYAWNITLELTSKVDNYRNPLQNLTSIVPILANEHIFRVLFMVFYLFYLPACRRTFNL